MSDEQVAATALPASSTPAPASAAPAPAATPISAPKVSPVETLLAKKAQEMASKENGTAQENKPNVEKGPSDVAPTPTSPAGEQTAAKTWDGNFANLEGLPAELHDKAKELQRKWTEATTQNAEASKKAAALDTYINSPEYQAFQQWQAAQAAKPQVEIAGVNVDAELAEAALTDPNALVSLVDRIAEAKVEGREKKAREQQVLTEKETYVASFANKTPDFWDVYDRYGPILKDQLGKGKSIDEAYAHAKSIEQSIVTREREAAQARVQEKKNGVTLTPSVKTESEIVWVGSQKESYEMARRLAEQGIRKEVRIKPREPRR